MAKVEIKLNRGGIGQLLKSQEMMNVVTKQAYSAQSKLSDGYEVSYRKDKTRVVAAIKATSPEAIRENYENNTILKVLKG